MQMNNTPLSLIYCLICTVCSAGAFMIRPYFHDGFWILMGAAYGMCGASMIASIRSIMEQRKVTKEKL